MKEFYKKKKSYKNEKDIHIEDARYYLALEIYYREIED